MDLKSKECGVGKQGEHAQCKAAPGNCSCLCHVRPDDLARLGAAWLPDGPTKTLRRQGVIDQELVNLLKKCPGDWMAIRYKSKSAANYRATKIRNGKYADFNKNDWEVLATASETGSVLSIRYNPKVTIA